MKRSWSFIINETFINRMNVIYFPAVFHAIHYVLCISADRPVVRQLGRAEKWEKDEKEKTVHLIKREGRKIIYDSPMAKCSRINFKRKSFLPTPPSRALCNPFRFCQMKIEKLEEVFCRSNKTPLTMSLCCHTCSANIKRFNCFKKHTLWRAFESE